MARQNGPYRIKMEAKRNIDLVNRYVAEQKPQREIVSYILYLKKSIQQFLTFLDVDRNTD